MSPMRLFIAGRQVDIDQNNELLRLGEHIQNVCIKPLWMVKLKAGLVFWVSIFSQKLELRGMSYELRAAHRSKD